MPKAAQEAPRGRRSGEGTGRFAPHSLPCAACWMAFLPVSNDMPPLEGVQRCIGAAWDPAAVQPAEDAQILGAVPINPKVDSSGTG